MLFSGDNVEKEEFVLEKDENERPGNVMQLYILSIERI